jgi:phage shock protein PspC (stress-responsive transcriptional regulator)
MEPKRLYRSLTDRKFAGVAGGLAEYFMIDPLLIRLIFVVLTLAGGGGVLIYLVLWIVTPEQRYIPNNKNMGNQTPPPREDHPENEPQKEPGYSESAPFAASVSHPPVNRHKGSLIGGLVLITLGALFLADELIPQIHFEDMWPVILIVVGVGLLIKTITKKNQDTNPL